MSYFKPIIFIALITFISSVSAQSKREQKIKAERELEIDRLLDSHGETFKITKVPEKWNNESAVIISQLKKYDFLIDGGGLVLMELLRQRLKIQDKAALEEFSKLYFTIPEDDSYRDNVLFIIKTDGTKKNVAINDAIEVEKGAISRSFFSFKTYQPKGYKYYKLAIPNLEVGDIIDFYSKKEISIPKEMKGSVIPFGAVINNLSSEYPIMNQKVDLSVDRSFYITANTYNGAPKLIEGGPGVDYKGRTKATIRTFSLTDSNREKKSDEYWVDISKEPKLKFQVFYATKKYLYYNPKYFIGDLDSIKEKVTTKEIVDRVSKIYEDYNANGISFNNPFMALDASYKNKYLYNYDFNNYNGKLNDTLKTALNTYYHMRWVWWSVLSQTLRMQEYYEKNGYSADNLWDLNKEWLIFQREDVPSDYDWGKYTMDDYQFLWYAKRDHWDEELSKLITSSKNIKREILVCVPKYLGSIDDILFMDELTYGLRIGGENGVCIFPPKNNSTMDNMDKYLEGTKAIAIKVVDYDDGGRYAKEFEEITLKNLSHKENTIKETTTLSFKDDPKINIINRTTQVTGNYRPMYIEDDIYGIDYWSEFKDDFKPKEGLSKKQQKKLEQKKSFSTTKYQKPHIQQERERIKQVHLDEIKLKKQEMMEEKIKDDFNLVSYDDFELISTGMRESNKTLEFKETFTVTGLVNKAGNNLILDIGKLIGSQIEIDEEEINNRKSDISLSRARTIENEVKINLPEGYYIEGLDNLLYNIDNEIGAFKTSFSEHNGQVVIKTIKLYKKKEFGKDKWPLMVEFLDAAYNFTQKKVVLKK